MGRPHPDAHLHRLRRWRCPPEDTSLRFIWNQFRTEIEKPYRQVRQLVDAWETLVPAAIARRTALASMSRGVLTVHVADSATLYELDRRLRSGLQRELQQRSPQTLRKVKLKLGPVPSET